MIGWNFPLNEDGPEVGINDPGIETFRSRPLAFLAREICQNSLDARNTENGTVEVTFALEMVPADEFPGKNELAEALEACLEYWRGRNKKARQFFEAALKVFAGKEVPFLQVSDYNTTGLIGAAQQGPSDWHNLIKAVGVSDKEAGQGGSFGIGKYAPFACSDLRTVFYSTLDREDVRAFQGVARLVAHQSRKKGGQTTQAVGFYGIENGNRPILNHGNIPPRFFRRKAGTDILIAGFAYPGQWKEETVRSVLEDFFVAIHRELLLVRVGDIEINRTSLPQLLEKYIANDAECYAAQYYASLVGEDSELYEDDFEELGKVALYVRRDKDGPKKAAMFRKTGMLIKEKGHFRTPVRFAGVFEARGDRLNQLLQLMEPPRHDDWRPERYSEDLDEVNRAKSLLYRLYKWINDCVKEVVQAEQAESVDAAGIGRYLPDDLDKDQPFEDEATGGEPEKATIQELGPRAPRPEATRPESGEPAPASEGEEPVAEPGEKTNAGEGGQPRTGGSGGGEGEGREGAAPGADGRRATRTRPLPLERVRAYCTDSANGIYRLVLVPKESGSTCIRVSFVGEEGWEPAPVRTALLVESGKEVSVDAQGRLGPLAVEAGKRYVVDIMLKERLRCALGVDADAD